MAAMRKWRDVPRSERARIARAVMRGRATADPRDSANAAALAERLLTRRPLISRRLQVWVAVVRLAPLVVAFAYLRLDARYLLPAVVYAAFAAYATWADLRRRARTQAALVANRAQAQMVGSVADIEFPRPDPNRPSPWMIRPRFALVVGTIFVLVPAAFALAAYTTRPNDGRSHAVRAVDAACQREHDTLQALRGRGLSNTQLLVRNAAIEERLMREIEGAIPTVERPPSLNLMLGWQNERIIALEDQASALRTNARERLFAANRTVYDATQHFLAQATVFGAKTCRAS